MVDFKKKLKKSMVRPKEPLAIYESLDRKTGAGPLRDVQKRVLKDWYGNRFCNKDLILKLHTGEGKTLVGLLMLQTYLYNEKGPCIYVCPNISLSQQVMREASKFGFNYCTTDTGIPSDFLNGKSILITHIQKVFNGKSIFKNNQCHIGCMILDDSHACVDSIRDSFTLKIPRLYDESGKTAGLYDDLLNLFEEDLKKQGEGSFIDVKSKNTDEVICVPYWAWIEKCSDVLKSIAKYTDEDYIKYTWPLVKDHLGNSHVYVSEDEVEIVPDYCAIEMFSCFDRAQHRVLMSATTQDDSFFIRGLNFNIDAIRNPLCDDKSKWSGEKMILIPSLIDETLTRANIVNFYARPNHNRKFGRFAITPSFSMANDFSHFGAIVAKKETIEQLLSSAKNGEHEKTIVLVNRYDGVDLPDDACRILIVDSLPTCQSLADRYELNCREDSDIVNQRLAQKIEQGIGRSVRGEKDYSAIIIIGPNLVKFIRSNATKQYFSLQTRKQIEIGLDIAESAKEEVDENTTPIKVLLRLIKQLVMRDESWKEYYKEQMDSIKDDDKKSDLYEIMQLEHKAERKNFLGDHEAASNIIDNLIKKYIKNENERGWYKQKLAQYKYYESKVDSVKIQKSAYEDNMSMLKPIEGITYKKLGDISATQFESIYQWINKFPSYTELKLQVDDTLDRFTFGRPSHNFEKAVQEIGEMLGFQSQRPDKRYRVGPDNLWCGLKGMFFMIECKDEVSTLRMSINKTEVGQMNNHCGWFEKNYGVDAHVKRIMIILTNKVAKDANFTHDVEIMDSECLTSLKKSIDGFVHELKNYKLSDLTEAKINEFLIAHKLTVEDLQKLYSKKVKPLGIS